MSEWKRVHFEDIDISEERGEIFLNLYLGSNDNGNIYAEVKWEHIEEAMEEFDKKRTKIK